MRLKFAITIYLNLFLQIAVFAQRSSDYKVFANLFDVSITKTNYILITNIIIYYILLKGSAYLAYSMALLSRMTFTLILPG